MITKIISKVKIHVFFYIFILISIFTGNFKDFTVFTLVILTHELGHILTGIYYKWDIEKILILPFSALTTFKTKINNPFKQELMVSIMGFIFQFLFYFILRPFNITNLKEINYGLFIFNLLPIYPLDGSKILNIFFNKFFAFKKSNFISIMISIMFIIPLFFLNNLVLYLALLFLIIENFNYYKKLNYIFLKFLLERMQYVFNYKKYKYIKELKIDKMYKFYKNIFYVNSNYYTERELLNKQFQKLKYK